jgi:Phage protein Gp138 N-terminal domain
MPIEQPQSLARPTLPQVLDAHIQAVLDDVHTVSWGTIQSYDPGSQTAMVQLCPRRSYVDDDGIRQTEQPAPLVSIPVIQPGSGGSSLTFPINSGDTVLVLFAEGAIAAWAAGGQADFDSGDDRRFHLTDGVAIVGLRNSQNVVVPAPSQSATVLTDPSEVLLGDQSASTPVLTTTDGGTFMAALATAIGTAPSTGVAALAALQTALTNLSWPVGAAKVKAI